ncbi:MAG: hypothetical protein EOQ98_26460 [Mesorhizobium sp.]|uniref:Restriction endonuclease type IV Mrr domain-containing protein n=2 Tax=Phyllobacteriaceae TaxID=69277 RepID=A0AB36R2E8_9HYPH|nr:hypothetical protein CIT25_29945 [Mesorhizobium mediterraneum]RUU74171.1 hypothetical protein EOC06_34335 [Mesorhizobium sp. M7A.F.Ca.MR.362.00.0.0]RWN24117.1 MAG: hypothetical protein EOR95_34515 [Mesorhizobium sp.]RWN27241.1 MAG: hypothetical protein EOR96_33745 [Mesorhizobium sp.]RWN85911.1 MAG: hypothetical protein EOS05_35990 [Mesorhizobium sp.]
MTSCPAAGTPALHFRLPQMRSELASSGNKAASFHRWFSFSPPRWNIGGIGSALSVRQSLTWRRGRGEPLMREEIEQLNTLLRGVSFRIPELTDDSFLNMLPVRNPAPVEKPIAGKPTAAQVSLLSQQLLEVSKLAPQPRGYAFEKFLHDLFAAYNLAPRGSFRLTGEQIDGSFALEGETYLLEAKWQNEYSGIADLHGFSGKVLTKAKWARGLFISNTGFSPDGLTAFGKAPTSIICMDGLDLHETLSRQLSVADVIVRKVRRAVETGGPFVRVRDLF